jgi:uncharacterized repeat protein (TIGR02059 family)
MAFDYYVSNDGNDNNSGLSSGLAWKTVAKVNSFTFLPGDRIFFKRGGEWRESLIIEESGTSSAMITFGAYGTGAKPIFNGADIVTGWSSHGGNIWSANCPAVAAYSGLPYDYVAIMSGTLLSQVGSLAAVDAAGKYFVDTSPAPDKIFLFSTTDPNNKKIEVSSRVFGVGVTDRSYIKLQNLDLRNSSHTGAYFNTNNLSGQFTGHSIVDSCNLYRNRIAGIEFDNGYSYNTVQYCSSTYNGNGFYSWSDQTWGSDNNTFSHCYSAHNIRYTTGIVTDGHGYGIYNSTDNIVEYCETEDDSYGINIDPNGRKNNIVIRYNYVHNTQPGTPGINAGGNVPSGTVHQIYGNLIVNISAGSDAYAIWIIGSPRLGSVYVYNNTIYLDGNVKYSGFALNASTGTNLIIKNNIIYSNASNSTIMSVNSGAGFACDNNLFFSPNDVTNIFTLNGINYHTLTSWQSATGNDLNSIYGDPLFVNNTLDRALQSGSPAINRGTDVGLTNDIKGNPLIGLPDIGAYEFQTGSSIPIPVFNSASVENSTPSILEMNYSLSLANVVPAVSSFSVLVNSVSKSVSSVTISGAKVLLTLSSQVKYGDIITVSYTKPAANPLQTTTGMVSESISLKPVTNNYNPAKPLYISSVIQNSTPSLIEMTYSLSLANVVPAASAFSVSVNSSARGINSVAIAGTKVQLTLSGAIVLGDLVTITYTKPLLNLLQTPSGGIAESIIQQPVTNNCLNPAKANLAPVVVIKKETGSFSGFIAEIDASASYDLNNEILSYEWIIPGNVSVSSTGFSKLKYLAPSVNSLQVLDFKLKVSDGKTIKEESVPVNILPYKPELALAKISNVQASSYQTPDAPNNVSDGNLSTRWSMAGDNQWLILKLSDPFMISHLEIAFLSGQQYSSIFDIYASKDNITWDPVLLRAGSCNFSGAPQVFDFPLSKTNTDYSYVKFIGHGNSLNNLNNISELKVFGSLQKNSGPADIAENKIIIYPNPAHDYINVTVGKKILQPDFIRIMDLLGQVVLQKRIDQDITNLQIPVNLSQGTYIVQFKSGNLTISAQKLVILN